MKKIIDHIRKERLEAKDEYPLENSIQNNFDDPEWESFRQKPTPSKVVIEHGKKFYQRAKTDPTIIKVHTYFREHGISRSTVERWKKRLPEFKLYYDFGVGEIGDRREALALYKNGSESLVIRTMANYDPDYRELLAWQAELTRKQEDAKAQSDAETIIEAVNHKLSELKVEEKKNE